MRKYAMPKVAYVLLVSILICLSIGYTYAYFSTHIEATSNVVLGKINVVWSDYESDARIPSLFDDPTSIRIDGELKRGEYTTIKARTKDDDENESSNIVLAMSNVGANVGAYCRIKLTATYTPKGSSTPINCDADWIQLVYSSKSSNKLITETDWFYYEGYYYYGEQLTSKSGAVVSRTLTELERSSTIAIANSLYLSTDASPAMFGASVNIVLTLEGVQTTNEAYRQVWELPENWIFE